MVKGISLFLRFALVLVALLIAACAKNNTAYNLVRMPAVAGAPPEMQDNTLYRRVQIGGWECVVPDDRPDAYLMCSGSDRPFIMFLNEGDKKEFWVTTDDEKRFFLTLFDSDADNNFDHSMFYVKTPDGESVKQVFDRDFDGEIDLALEQSNSQVRFDGEMRKIKVDPVSGEQTINVEGVKYIVKGGFETVEFIKVD